MTGIDRLLFDNTPTFEVRVMDFRDLRSSDLAGFDAIIHLAALVGDPLCNEAPALAQEINYVGTQNLLSFAESAGVPRFIFASTCSNYGALSDTKKDLLDEDSPLQPLTLYAGSKVSSEILLLTKAQRCNPTVLRFATLFGLSSRMRFDLTVNHFTRDLHFKKSLQMFAAKSWRPYVHVEDAARAILRVLESPIEIVKRQVFNIGDSSQNFTKEQIANAVRVNLATPVSIEIELGTAPDARNYRVSFDKAKAVLDFVPTRSLDDGIKEILVAFNNGRFSDAFDPKYHNSFRRTISLF